MERFWGFEIDCLLTCLRLAVQHSTKPAELRLGLGAQAWSFRVEGLGVKVEGSRLRERMLGTFQDTKRRVQELGLL